MKNKIINNELIIEIPDGFDLIKQNDGSFILKKIQYPTKWEYIGELKGFFITFDSQIERVNSNSVKSNRCTYPSIKLADAGLALTQLVYLRELYNDGWVPNWEDSSKKFIICINDNEISTIEVLKNSKPLSFRSSYLREKFIENFRDLLEIAKPLL
jgi:hypothetical protein